MESTLENIQEMSLGAKIGLAITGITVFGIGVYFLTKPKIDYAAIAQTNNLKGAINAQDELAVKNMVNVLKTSPLSKDLGYIASILPDYMIGGKNQPSLSNGYDTIIINGQPVLPKSSALKSAIWTGWLGTYVKSGWNSGTQQPQPSNAKVKQKDADAAASVALQVAKIWEDYRTKELSVIF